MMKYRIGLVACGGIAHAHLKGYRLVLGERAEVVAACDPNAETLNRFCDTYGIAHRFACAEQMVRSGAVDVIAVLTPPAVHHKVLLPAFESRVHVLCEKPFGESLADASEFVTRAEAAGVQLAVNQNLRWMPEVDAVRAELASGRIGSVRLFTHEHYQRRTTVAGWRGRERRLEISIFSIHLLDRLRWLVGAEPVVVSCITRHATPSQVPGELPTGEMFSHLVIQFAGGIVGTMTSSWLSQSLPECRMRVDGDCGSVTATKRAVMDDAATLCLERLGEAASEREVRAEQAALCSYGRSMGHLLDAIETGVPAPNSGRDNLLTMAIVDGAYLSAAQDGVPVCLAALRVGLDT